MSLISVVTPSYNQAAFIGDTIESVRNQGVSGIEHIIVDGGSKDGTLEILRRSPDITWISEADRGQSDALNKGIARAQGKWIVWINSDDCLLPGALEKFMIFASAHPEARFVFSNTTFVDEESKVIGTRRASYDPRSFPYWWREGGTGFGQPGTFFTKSLWREYGPFDVDLHYAMDYDFWLRIHEAVPFLYLDDCLATYRLHGATKTAEGWRPSVEELITVTQRYWDRRGLRKRWEFRFLLSAMYGTSLMCQGMRVWESGDRREGGILLRKAWKAHPPSLASPTHMRFLLRRLVGPRAYDRLSQVVPGLKRLNDVIVEREYHKS